MKYLNVKYSEYEIIACDSATFSPKSVKTGSWCPQNDPILHASKWCNTPRYLCVHSAASKERGIIHSMYKQPVKANKKNGIEKQGGFNSKDILEFYKELKAKCFKPFALFCDNGGYQSSVEIRAWLEENGIPVIQNVKYRPEFNGIEECWAYAKRQYRQVVLYHKAMLQDWDQLQLVS
jgi:hypothetical protein